MDAERVRGSTSTKERVEEDEMLEIKKVFPCKHAIPLWE
jgi:hypothetical protein